MSISSYLNRIKDHAYLCIESNLKIDINARAVQINYLNEYSFYKLLEANRPDVPETLLILNWECTQGIYKWNEKEIFIKTSYMFDAGLLLVELLHSRAIFQGKKYVQDWISEGIPHFLAKKLCDICDEIKYTVSENEKSFILFWEKIHHIYEKYGLDIFITILYPSNSRIELSILLLKGIFNYTRDDILTIEFEEAQKKLSLLGY